MLRSAALALCLVSMSHGLRQPVTRDWRSLLGLRPKLRVRTTFPGTRGSMRRSSRQARDSATNPEISDLSGEISRQFMAHCLV